MGESNRQQHLPGLIDSAGRAIAKAPDAKSNVERLRQIEDRRTLRDFLQNVDLGLDEPAARLVREAVTDEQQWHDRYSALLRSAEQQLADAFSANA